MSTPLISINNTALPAPTKYNVPTHDLDSSDTTRNEQGILIRNRVRQGVVKIELSWTATSSVIAQIAPLVEPEKVTAQYFNPQSNQFETANLYVGDRSCNLVMYTDGMDLADALWEYSFNLIEY